MSAQGSQIRGVIFDKDGTLFDFRKTWDHWARELLVEFSQGDQFLHQDLASAIDFDLASGGFRPGSVAIAGTSRQVAQALAVPLGHRDVAALDDMLAERARHIPLTPVVDLVPFLKRLKAAGLALGVMTNDVDSVTHAHLGAAGCLHLFDFVCSSDSGHGAKPDAAPLLAFCSHVGVDPFHTVMVGDSTHDLLAAGRAGMGAIGVLTGLARAAELAPLADVVLDDIGEFPDWLGLGKPDEG